MAWTKPLKIIQMVLASLALMLTAYGAVAYMVHPGYAITWFCFAWTLVFSVLRVFNREHDTRTWRSISIGFDVTNIIVWAIATALLAKDGTWLMDGKNGGLPEDDPRTDYPYQTWALAGLYCTYAAAAVAGVLAISFLITGGEGARRWRAPPKAFDKKEDKKVEYNPLEQYDYPKHWSSNTSSDMNLREV